MWQVTYRERLHIPWWWGVIGFLFVASIAVVVFFSMDTVPALAVSLLSLVGVGLFLVAYSRTLIAVENGAVRAGRNHLEAAYIGGAEALCGDAARRALGPESDSRAFLFTRPFVRDVVRIEVADPADPHPHWLVSTRRPQELAAAVEALR